MALNMFSIEETKLRSGSSSATTPTTYRSVAQVTIITLMLTIRTVDETQNFRMID